MNYYNKIMLLSSALVSMISIAGFFIIWLRVKLDKSKQSIWPSVISGFVNLFIFFAITIFTKEIPFLVLFEISYSSIFIWGIYSGDKEEVDVRGTVLFVQVAITILSIFFMIYSL